MASKIRLAQGGKQRSVYVEVGFWKEGSRIHVALATPGKGHFQYGPGDSEYVAFRALLEEAGRWYDDDAIEPEPCPVCGHAE